MLDCDTNIKQLFEAVCVLTKSVLRDDAGRMHTGNVEGSHVSEYSLPRKHSSAFTDDLVNLDKTLLLVEPYHLVFRILHAVHYINSLSRCFLVQNHNIILRTDRMSVVALPALKAVSWELLRQIRIIELHLRLRVIPKYKPGGQLVCGIVHGHACDLGQNLSRLKVAGQFVKYSFRCNHIVIAVRRDLGPSFFRHRLIPRQSKLLMVNPKFNFPLFQTLFLCREVVHISVGNIISVSEHGVLTAINDPLTQPINGFIVVSDHSGVQNMIVVPPAVKPDQLLADQFVDLAPAWINHPDDTLAFSRFFPVDQQQIRKHLNIKENQRLINRNWLRLKLVYTGCAFFNGPLGNIILYRPAVHLGARCRLLRVKVTVMQRSLYLHADVLLMGAFRRKRPNSRPHVPNIITQSRIPRVVQRLLDQTHGCRRMRLLNIFSETLRDDVPQMLFVLYTFKVNHVIFSRLLLRQSAFIQRRYRDVVAKAQPSPKALLSEINLDLNIIRIHAFQLHGISVVNVMQMDPLPALAVFRIGLRPLIGGLQIQQCILLAFLILNIKVDHNMVQRSPYKVQLRRVNIFQRCLAEIPSHLRLAASFRFLHTILRLAVLQHLVQQGLCLIKNETE